jgi:hypothetical protein
MLGVGMFTALYLALGAWTAWARGNHEFQFYIGALLVCLLAVGVVHRRVGLSAGVLWGLSLWGAAHLAGGMVAIPETWPAEGTHVLYNWRLGGPLLKFDQAVHAYGFGMVTWTCWEGLRWAVASRVRVAAADIRPTAGLLVLCVAAGMGFGAINEVVEFVATLTIPDTNVGGYLNTGWDLVANLVGTTTAALAIAMGGRKHTAT